MLAEHPLWLQYVHNKDKATTTVEVGCFIFVGLGLITKHIADMLDNKDISHNHKYITRYHMMIGQAAASAAVSAIRLWRGAVSAAVEVVWKDKNGLVQSLYI